MKLKILTVGVIILGCIWFGCIWFYNWRSTDNAILAKHNIHNVPRGPAVTAKPRALPSRGRDNTTVQQYESTAYTWTGNRTASGTWPKAGRTIAVNPDKIPLGSIVTIEGLGQRIAEDIIPPESVKKGADIDLYLGRGAKAIQEAKKHGRRMIRVIKE